MQIEIHFEDGKEFLCSIPNSEQNVLPNVTWGNVSRLFTPAYWRITCITNEATKNHSIYRLGNTFKEEVVACLLGGHGISGELGNAAFRHLLENGIFNGKTPSCDKLESLLSERLPVKGKLIRYRYPKQKAKYISNALQMLYEEHPPDKARPLRDWLVKFPGVGLKTASWIVRNYLDADDVAILDIHIHRAGVIAGFFNKNDDVRRSYLKMEEKFIHFAKEIGIHANVLDNQIWNQIRSLPSLTRKMLIERGVKQSDRCGLPTSNNSRAAWDN